MKKSIFINKKIDFLALGGVFFVLAPFLAAIPSSETLRFSAYALILANLINHPHFAFSYQIFYRNLATTFNSVETSSALKIRYIVVGFVIPLILIAYLYNAISSQDLYLLGILANVMAFFVGWHYVKQGFGILMVDSVTQQFYFSEKFKNLLKYNAYICWIFFWLLANQNVSQLDMWGVKYYTFEAPELLIKSLFLILIFSSGCVIYSLYIYVKKSPNKFPASGFTAYILSCYVWIGVNFNPILFLFVPAIHSLQYIYIVLKLETNRLKDQFHNYKLRLILFLISGCAIGYYSFWVLPKALENGVDLDENIFTSGTFLFSAWIFINIHHYFIDNVIWKKDNIEVKKYIFSSPIKNN